MKIKFLSYPLNASVPTYGNRLKVRIGKYKSISDGSTVNESYIDLPLHAGTHVDFPNHFYANGSTLNDFEDDFWIFNNPLIVDITPSQLILHEDLILKLDGIKDSGYDILLIRTGAYEYRNSDKYWSQNHGIHGEVASYLRVKFPFIRCVGFDFISLTSIHHSDIGKEAHLQFLKPESPILVVEDMDLSSISDGDKINELVIAPLRIENVDGVPVTCLAKIN